MFRRKKSTTDLAQRGTAAISISGPMRIAAQAPHPPLSPSAAPLYERFAKTTNANVSMVAGPARRSASSARTRLTDGEGSMKRSEVRQEYGGQRLQQHGAGKSGAQASRAEERAGLGNSIPSREEDSRFAQHRHQQQLSPPTSPTLPRANAAPNLDRRPMPNVDEHALDDPPPPTRLLSKSNRVIREREPEKMSVPVPRTVVKAEREDTQLSRMLTPPSPPPTNSSASDSLPGSMPLPSPSRTPLRSAAVPPLPSSFARPSPSPSSPTTDESGLLSGGSTLKSSPSLGNSLETRHGPRKTKYSPLAAFGPSTSTSASTGSSSSLPTSQDAPPPTPPKPTTSVASPTVPTFTINSSYLPDSGPVPDPAPDLSAGRPSFDAFTNSDRHASLQPLKTASVELRVGLGADELETFHSPLFGAGFDARSSEEHGQDDGNGMGTHVKPKLQPMGEPNNRSLRNVTAVMPSNGRTAFLGARTDAGREEEGDRIKVRTRGRSGRVATVVSPAKMEVEMPPTPPSPPAPQPSMLHDSEKESGENELGRKRSASASSVGSARRRATVYTKFGDEDVPSMPTVQQNQPQTPPTVMRGQIPTPPTSVDGHGQNQRLTIASVLEGERSPDVPSSSSLDSRRVRKTNSARRLIPDFSSLPSADAEANGHARQGESHGDIISSEMAERTTLPPSMSASSSSSSADVVHREGMQGKPTPKVHTQDLPSLVNSHHVHQGQHHAPLSPPQSPPQPLAPALSPSQSRSRARSKSRTRSNRPGTGSSAHSQNYVPPSSASSSDGPGRSPSALSALVSFSSSSGNSSPRKLTKTPPLSARIMTEGASVAEQYRHQHQRQITESSEDVDMLVDADPFAKDEIVRTPLAGETMAASASVGSMTPPVPPFAQGSGTTSGPPSPASSGDYFSSRARRRGERLDAKPRETAQALANMREGTEGEETPRPIVSGSAAGGDEQMKLEPEPEPAEPTFYPLEKHLMHADLLAALLPHLVFRDWCALVAVNDAMRRAVEHKRELREAVLEHFLRMVGYMRWRWSTKEHIMLTFRDLNSYMRGVSIPSHQYAVYGKAWLDARQQAQKLPADEYIKFNLKAATAQKSLLASSCRAYSRVVLRLRAQAEAIERDGEGEEPVYQFTPPQSTTSVNAKAHAQVQMQAHRSVSRVRTGTPSRPASPAASSISHSQHGHHLNGNSNGHTKVNRYERATLAALGPRFRSPLFRLGHAPCLRVCVPSPEGVWLSDASVLECERELKRAGIVPLLRVGDVVWDIAVGDEGNVGRMVWDGNYLIDLDYTYSRTGEAPQYLHTLSFPPSYFHRVIRTSGNPICYIDISPWGEEIAANLQLLQDRIKAETPQGGHHTVVRWIHRSKFRIRPNPYTNAPIAIPDTSLAVDPGWFGTVIIEIEGTNEGLADLQQRCRSGFPPRAVGGENGNAMKMKPASRVFRLLRERSRPGEIWLRAVRDKERLL